MVNGKGRPRLSQEEFITRCKAVHGDTYDYSKVNYIQGSKKVTITCSVHGDFDQYPYSHLVGRGCRKCGRILQQKNHRLSTLKRKLEEINEELNEIGKSE